MGNQTQRDRTVLVLIFIVIFLAITSYMRGDWKIRIPSSVTRLFVNPVVAAHTESEPETLDYISNLQGRTAKVSLSSNDPDYDKAALDAVKSTDLPPLPDNLPDTVNFQAACFLYCSSIAVHCLACNCLLASACDN